MVVDSYRFLVTLELRRRRTGHAGIGSELGASGQQHHDCSYTSHPDRVQRFISQVSASPFPVICCLPFTNRSTDHGLLCVRPRSP